VAALRGSGHTLAAETVVQASAAQARCRWAEAQAFVQNGQFERAELNADQSMGFLIRLL